MQDLKIDLPKVFKIILHKPARIGKSVLYFIYRNKGKEMDFTIISICFGILGFVCVITMIMVIIANRHIEALEKNNSYIQDMIIKMQNILKNKSATNAVAEHAMAMLLTSIRRIHKAFIRTRDFNFSLNGMTGFDLHGKTVGVGHQADGRLRVVGLQVGRTDVGHHHQARLEFRCHGCPCLRCAGKTAHQQSIWRPGVIQNTPPMAEHPLK